MSNAIGFSTESNSYFQSTESIGVSTESISKEIEFQKQLIAKEIDSEIQVALNELNSFSSNFSTSSKQPVGQQDSTSQIPPREADIQIEKTTNNTKPSNETISSKTNIEINSTNIFKYDATISRVSKKYNVPESLIHSVIKAESGYDEKAKSGVGALGLMQLMPATAASLGVKNPLNATENIEGGVKYLSQMITRYDGNVTLALAAYNAGPGNVDKYGGVPPFEETQNYIKKILKQ